MNPQETRLRVRYAETDQMGVVYYANYLIWMELGRVELCRSIGLHYKEMEERDGIYLVVAEANCRYHFPARYDEEVAVYTAISESRPRTLRFSYQMTSAATGRKLATGSTMHVYCGRDMRPCKLPEKYRRIFETAPGIQA
ncbi:MAG TPA: thioesterase family protein [Bryobacteraceae bacterium]|nr:thioesterase family protein [Bryobacteraceae bacterium]